MPSYKLIISCHDEHPTILASEHIIYMQTGKANAQYAFKGMIGDDTGENISAKNTKYNELSAQYWAWKNYEKLGSPDYIGFMHYRRHFLFNMEKTSVKKTWLLNSNVFVFPCIDKKYMYYFGEDYIDKYINEYDCLVIYPYDVKNLGKNNIREQYLALPEQNEMFFDVFIECSKRIIPDYKNEIEMIEHGSMQYLCNMFIMRKDLFFQYSKFIFCVLQEIEKSIDTTGFSKQKQRFLGYFGEFLLSIFIFKIKKEKNVRVKEMNASFIISDKYIRNPKFEYLKYYMLSKIFYGNIGKEFMKKKVYYKNIYKYIKHKGD